MAKKDIELLGSEPDFCPNVECESGEVYITRLIPANEFQVQYKNCRCAGPTASTKLLAMKAWNENFERVP